MWQLGEVFYQAVHQCYLFLIKLYLKKKKNNITKDLLESMLSTHSVWILYRCSRFCPQLKSMQKWIIRKSAELVERCDLTRPDSCHFLIWFFSFCFPFVRLFVTLPTHLWILLSFYSCLHFAEGALSLSRSALIFASSFSCYDCWVFCQYIS